MCLSVSVACLSVCVPRVSALLPCVCADLSLCLCAGLFCRCGTQLTTHSCLKERTSAPQTLLASRPASGSCCSSWGYRTPTPGMHQVRLLQLPPCLCGGVIQGVGAVGGKPVCGVVDRWRGKRVPLLRCFCKSSCAWRALRWLECGACACRRCAVACCSWCWTAADGDRQQADTAERPAADAAWHQGALAAVARGDDLASFAKHCSVADTAAHASSKALCGRQMQA